MPLEVGSQRRKPNVPPRPKPARWLKARGGMFLGPASAIYRWANSQILGTVRLIFSTNHPDVTFMRLVHGPLVTHNFFVGPLLNNKVLETELASLIHLLITSAFVPHLLRTIHIFLKLSATVLLRHHLIAIRIGVHSLLP